MIRSYVDLQQAQEALCDLYKALASLKDEAGSNPESFALLAEGPLHEVSRIQADIDAYVGISALRDRAHLWLRLVGPKARWGEMSTSVLTAFLDAVRKGVQSIATYDATGRPSKRPPIEIIRACDLELINIAPGSFQIGLRLPDPDQGSLFEESVATRALEEFLAAAEWAASNSDRRTLESLLNDVTQRRLALRAVKAVVPRGSGGVLFLELSGSMVHSKDPIHLATIAADRIQEALEEAVSEHEERHEGDIREMDLDRQTFKLRGRELAREVLCHFTDDLYPTMTALLGKRVRVIGVRRLGGKLLDGLLHRALDVVDIEPIEPKQSRR
jgi:hypothetical protein